MDWTTFGWAGITLNIPADWELSGLSGDEKEGYLRLDDEEIPRLELKWAGAKRKKPDLQRVLDEYFKLVRKNYKRKDAKLNIQRDVNLLRDEGFFEGRDVVTFSWKGDIRASGVIFHCETCKRITIIQVMGRLKENFRPTLARILQSVRDHPTGQDILWSAYNLNVEIPRRYRLEKHRLLSGYLLLPFADGSRKVSVERYGPADVTLVGSDLEAWFRAKYAKAIRGYGFEIIPHNTDDGDERFTLVGEELRFTDHIPFSPVLAVDKVLRRKTFAACLWRCHKSNRIYVIQAIAKRDAVKTAESVAASIKCH
jgi:hypothetical protein